MWLDRQVDIEALLRLTNRNLIAFDAALGSGALLAPDATLRALGHDEPSPDARHLFRRCGPIWLTFAAAHAVAERDGDGALGRVLADDVLVELRDDLPRGHLVEPRLVLDLA